MARSSRLLRNVALYHDGLPDRIFVLITTYIDESGTHDTNVMTIGGLVGRLGQWVTFDSKWNKLLKKEGIPYFHMKSFKHSETPFRGWDDARKFRVMDKISRIIHRNTMFGFTIALDADDYRELYLTDDKPKKVRFDSKYGLCFRLCLSMVPDLLTAAIPKQEIELHFVLEEGHKNFGDAKRVFDEFKDRGPPHTAKMLRTITAGRNIDFPGLQGADVPAHLSFRGETTNDVPIIEVSSMDVMAKRSYRSLASAPIFRQRFTKDHLEEARANAIEEVTRRIEYGRRKHSERERRQRDGEG